MNVGVRDLSGSPAARDVPRDSATKVFWYLGGPDGDRPWLAERRRRFDLAYAGQIARTVDGLGFDGVLVGTGAHDTWVLSASLIEATSRLKFLIATYPPLISAALSAKMAQTFEYFAPGRLILNVINGTTDAMQALGSRLGHDERYALTDEWLEIWRAAVRGEPYDFDGVHAFGKGSIGRFADAPVAAPPLWFAGSSDAAIAIAARHIDNYLSWGEPPDQLAAKNARVATLARAAGRSISFGVRLNIVMRDSDEEAWREADRILKSIPQSVADATAAVVSRSDSVGARRMSGLHGGRIPERARDLEIAPGLWSGLGLVRHGPGTAIVGSPTTVLSVLDDYRTAGIDTFILSGSPLLEEAWRVGEQLLPKLRAQGAATRQAAPDITAVPSP